MKIKNANDADIKLGINDYSKVSVVKKLDHVKLPRLKEIVPKYMSCDIVVLSIFVPGTGRWQR